MNSFFLSRLLPPNTEGSLLSAPLTPSPTSGDGLRVAFFLYFSNTRRKGQVCVYGKMTVYQNKFIFFLKPSEETVSI